MKSWFAVLRMVAWLKRIALALEMQNELCRERMRFEFPTYDRKGRRAPKLTEISVPSVEDRNNWWREDHYIDN